LDTCIALISAKGFRIWRENLLCFVMLKISESEAEIIISCVLIDEEGENRRGNISDNRAHNICKKRMNFGDCHFFFIW